MSKKSVGLALFSLSTIAIGLAVAQGPHAKVNPSQSSNTNYPIQPRAAMGTWQEPAAGLRPGARPLPQKPITVNQLYKEFRIVSELGYPFESVQTLTIQVADDILKGESSPLLVHRINGQPLTAPLRIEGRIWQHAKPMPAMTTKRLYDVRAFAELEFPNALPTEAMMENNVPVPQASSAGFCERLQIISLIR